MLDFLGSLQRTHTCGQLRAEQGGQPVVLMGWVNRRRDHGNLIFLDVRDRTGITQVVLDKEVSGEAHAKAEAARSEYVVAVKGHHEALNLYRQSNRRWTYVSPSAEIHPGTRTGRFRVGGDQLLADAEGRSHISYEDFAVAILDEIEEPRHIQRRFTVGY